MSAAQWASIITATIGLLTAIAGVLHSRQTRRMVQGATPKPRGRLATADHNKPAGA